jgi:uncharacterized protein (TIGR02596 family)
MNYLLPSDRLPKAFSLLELLVVMSIIGVIITLSIPTFSGVLEANSISRSSHIVIDHISQARQMAAAQNTSIEVRFARQPAAMPSTATGATGVYNAVQLWRTDPSGGPAAPVSKLELLPTGFVVAVGAGAPYLSPPLAPAAIPAPLSGTVDHGGTSLNYVGFEIRPAGLIPSMLDQSLKNTFITITALRDADSTAAGLSGPSREISNYAIVQLNPLTGSAQVYQP